MKKKIMYVSFLVLLVVSACAASSGVSPTGASPSALSGGVSATPSPTPIEGPTSEPELWVMIHMTIAAREPAIIAGGLSPVQIFASARARLPTVLDGPITVIGNVTVSPHPNAPPECSWPRTLTKPDFKMTVYHSGDLSILVSVDGPDWYYTILCPAPAPPIRFPAFGEEGIRYYLQYALEPYRTGDGVRLPTDVYTGYPSGSGCLKRWAQIQASAFNADVQVDIWVYQPDYPGGCLLPLLP